MAVTTRAQFDQHLSQLFGSLQQLLDAIAAQQAATPADDFSAEDQQVKDAAAKVQDTMQRIGPPPVTAGNTVPANPVSDQNPTPAVQVQPASGATAGGVTVPQNPTGIAVVPPPDNPQPVGQPSPPVAETPTVAVPQPGAPSSPDQKTDQVAPDQTVNP